MDDMKLLAKKKKKNEKELVNLIQTIRIYNHDIGMEFGIENCIKLFIKM